MVMVVGGVPLATVVDVGGVGGVGGTVVGGWVGAEAAIINIIHVAIRTNSLPSG